MVSQDHNIKAIKEFYIPLIAGHVAITQYNEKVKTPINPACCKLYSFLMVVFSFEDSLL